jgi:hypothetical protein
MWKDAISPIIGGVISILVISLSAMVLTVQDGTVNPSGNSFASVQLVIGIVGFLVSLWLAVVWWRRPEQFKLEYEGREDPPPPSCMFHFFAFLVALSILSLSTLILMSETKKTDAQGSNPSATYIIGVLSVTLSVITLVYFGAFLVRWGIHKYRA